MASSNRKTIIGTSNEVREKESLEMAVKSRLSKMSVFSGFAESALVGLSFFTSFLAQKVYIDLRSYQFPFGHGELIEMSLGIAFCYGFIFVLRRCYRNQYNVFTVDAAKDLVRLTLESYLLYIAMLFLIKDINFASAKLAVGISFFVSVCFIAFYRVALARILAKEEIPSRLRKITLKKQPVPVRINEPSAKREGNIDSEIRFFENPPEFAHASNRIFVLNSAEDIKRLELIENIKELQVKIGNLSISRIPEAVRVARKRGVGIEIAPPLD